MVKTGSIYRLPANGAEETRNKLYEETAFVSTIIMVILTTIYMLIVSFVAHSIMSDIQCDKDFPGCDPLLDEMYRNKQLEWYSVTNRTHRMIAASAKPR